MPTQLQPTIQNILNILDRIAPFATTEPWDNTGLMVGSPTKPVSSILLALDPTLTVLREALAKSCDTIITHHPLLFHPLKSVRTDSPIGALISQALQHDIAIISCHSNLDLAAQGVNDALAKKIDLEDIQPLTLGLSAEGKPSFGRIGRYLEQISAKTFLQSLLKKLCIPLVKIAGPLPLQVSTVAVCGGSGSELAETALRAGADIFLSSEIKHSTARWAEDMPFCVVDAGHFATENVILDLLAEQLVDSARSEGMTLLIARTDKQGDPFQYFMKDTLVHFD